MAEAKMNLSQKLSLIQSEIKAPKNLRNTFGGYNYRNAESILEAFKPLAKKYKVALTVSDSIEFYADRVYVKATAKILDCESEESFVTTAYAREAATKKGMDDAQVTGATSSYARKYALNGLLLLDDTKDVDTDEYKQESDAMQAKQQEVNHDNDPITAAEAEILQNLIANNGIDVEYLKKLYKISDVTKVTKKVYANIAKNITKIKEKQEAEKA